MSSTASVAGAFANSEADLVGHVPPYWMCYACTYFTTRDLPADPDKAVQSCVTTPLDGTAPLGGGDGDTRPELASPVSPQFPQRDADLQPVGLLRIHLLVQADGSPVGLQIVRAVGGGLDEAVLSALAQAKFRPATRDGKPVMAGVDLSFEFTSKQATPR